MIILPCWNSILSELSMKACMMLWDVTTWWNSTYGMVEFAVNFWEVLDTITGDKDMKLQKYEMDTKSGILHTS